MAWSIVGGGGLPAGLNTADLLTGGFLDYSDLNNSALAILSGVSTTIPNDELGAQTRKTQRPSWVNDLWVAGDSEFDWTDLNFGTLVNTRFDSVVTTTSPNQRVVISLELAQGGFSYSILFIDTVYKSIGTYFLNRLNEHYIDDANTRDNPGQFKIFSDADCTLNVSGWTVSVVQRG